MNRLSGILLLLLSSILFLGAAASLFGVVHALTVQTTLAAIESAFGRLVIGIALLALGRIQLRAGLARLRREDNAQT